MPLDIEEVGQRDYALMERFLDLIDRVWKPYHRFEVRGLEHIPEGAALYVGNHNGGLLSIDSFLFANDVFRERGMKHVPYGLAHDMVMSFLPAQKFLIRIGGIRANHASAKEVFSRGEKALVYPGGDVDSMRPWKERDLVKFDGRTGYIKLAVSAGVPIVPLVASGAQSTFYVVSDNQWLAKTLKLDKMLRLKVLPLMLTFPWGLTLGPSPPYVPFPTKIKMEVLPPMYFEGGDEACKDEAYIKECNGKVHQALQEKLSEMAYEG